MPQPMTVEQRRAFLTRGTPAAVLATVRADGRPHAVPVWFALDGDDILLNTSEETVKAANILRDPRVAVLVHDDAPPYAFAMVEGVAEVSRDPGEIRRGSEPIARRYLDGDAAEGWIQYATAPGKVLVRVRPTRVVAIDRVGG